MWYLATAYVECCNSCMYMHHLIRIYESGNKYNYTVFMQLLLETHVNTAPLLIEVALAKL